MFVYVGRKKTDCKQCIDVVSVSDNVTACKNQNSQMAKDMRKGQVFGFTSDNFNCSEFKEKGEPD